MTVPAHLATEDRKPGCIAPDCVGELRLAYLTSTYPAISHTFIYREIAALRRLGTMVRASSVNPPDRPVCQLPMVEQAEAATAFYVKSATAAQILSALCRTLLAKPMRLGRVFRIALEHGGASGRQLIRWCGYLVEAVIIGDWLERQGLTHLHVHFATEVANVGYLASQVYDIDLSMTVHGPDEFYDVTRNLISRKVAAARLVCCISYYTRSQLMKLTTPEQWHKFHVVRLGVDLNEFAPQPFRIDPKIFELLCVGRLVPAKGQHILLRAMQRLVALGYDVRLRLVGDGPDRASLEKYCRQYNLTTRVIFEGPVNQDRIRDFLKSADLFVMASFAEGIPVSLMEAMASEVACVATTITGIPELIRQEVDGLLVPASNEDALVGAIARLIDDPVLRREISKAGRARVADKFEINQNVARLRNLLREHIH